MPNIEADLVIVAVGVLIENSRVLISQRPDGVHLANFWEFPGGKVEPDESIENALAREFEEELGIQLQGVSPLFNISHRYPEKSVQLEVYRIHTYLGMPAGKEGQTVKWCSAEDLVRLEFPPANQKILDFVLGELQPT